MSMEQLLQKNQTIALTIDGMTAEGNGVGHYQGMAVFVPQTAVGDVLDVKIVKVCKHFAYGISQTVHVPSPDRILPDCPVYKQCGGCLFRHISYEAECRMKQQFVADAFQRIGGLKPELLPILSAEQINGYRNKAQLPCGVAANGNGVVFGVYAPRSHRLIPQHGCLLQPPSFQPVIERSAELLAHITPYDEGSGKGVLRHLYLRQGHHSHEMMVCFVVAKNISKQLCTIAKQLAEEFHNITSVMMNVNPHKTNVILGGETLCLWGKPCIEDVFCGIPVMLNPHSFYQINTLQAERLFAEVRRMVNPQKHQLLLDLYCGTGVIGLTMADAVDKLIGVEVVAQAVENAKQNAMAIGAGNAHFFVGDAGEIARQLARGQLTPHIITLDPPRKGCDKATLDACIAMAPCTIAMVSCNPATAARDTKYLCEHGYAIHALRPVDLFPRTGHVEAVVLLSKLKADHHIEVELNTDELDLTSAESKATYDEIKAYVKEHTGLSVSSLYIAQVKQKYGLEKRENYNKAKSKDSKQPKCPKEKEEAIVEALRYFKMI